VKRRICIQNEISPAIAIGITGWIASRKRVWTERICENALAWSSVDENRLTFNGTSLHEDGLTIQTSVHVDGLTLFSTVDSLHILFSFLPSDEIIFVARIDEIVIVVPRLRVSMWLSYSIRNDSSWLYHRPLNHALHHHWPLNHDLSRRQAIKSNSFGALIFLPSLIGSMDNRVNGLRSMRDIRYKWSWNLSKMLHG
jgi:hypothetical protein